MAAISPDSMIGTCNKNQSYTNNYNFDMLSAILDICHSQNHKRDCHFSKIDDRDLQEKQNTKFGSIYNWYLVL